MNRREVSARIRNRRLWLGTTTLYANDPQDWGYVSTEARSFSNIPEGASERVYQHTAWPTAPLDEVLGLLERPDERRVWDLRGVYGTFGLISPPKRGLVSSKDVAEVVDAWRRKRLPRTFLAAAEDGTGGMISASLSTHLERVRFGSEAITVPDLPALAAWALLEHVRAGKPYDVRPCANCELMFLASPRARYCKRRAPQSDYQSCQDYAKVRDYHERKKGERNG